jgi:hypothetical protein
MGSSRLMLFCSLWSAWAAEPRVVVSEPVLVAEAPADVRRWGSYSSSTAARPKYLISQELQF